MQDHSTIYTDGALRNRGHRKRLTDILDAVREHIGTGATSYADYGCSNGYITERVASIVRPERAKGFDYREDLIESARSARAGIDFDTIDLNAPLAVSEKAQFVTCFETLEHLGHLDTAAENICSAIEPGGRALVSVPIEIGPIGIAKYLVKVGVFRYSLDTLEPMRFRRLKYLGALLRGSRISAFRGDRSDWASHFGFDYRDLDDLFASSGLLDEAWNKGTSRFYLLSR